MSHDPTTPYNLSFTGASLRPDLARIVAEQYREVGDWEAAKQRIRETNALQCRTKLSLKTLETELRLRLSTLTQKQMELLVRGTAEERTAMAWLAALKRIRYAFDFTTEVLRGKLEAQDPVLRPSDYEAFVASKVAAHPELLELADSSRAKIRQVLYGMLKEAGLIGGGRSERPIHRPVLTPTTIEAVAEDDPTWMAGFLVNDDEIRQL
jgi:hypothetical protein